MKAKVYFIFILYELLNLSNISCKDCDETDMGHHITKCDSSNKRKGNNIFK